jgi:hypothetical protein
VRCFGSSGGAQQPNSQISEVGFETVDFSGCFSNAVSKIETYHPDQSIQIAYNKELAISSDANGIRTRVMPLSALAPEGQKKLPHLAGGSACRHDP